MKPILEIRQIGKRFKLRGQELPYQTIREGIKNIFKKTEKRKKKFWALQDITFDVHPGDSIGIIGKNGAGKTTLLKILSRITPPTTGHIFSRGRIASLLEVGTGFHLELTGRENIFLNGSILGLTRAEIKSKFDEIVNFSGVETFLDTPLKHYSTGMQLRLAFSVAAHLEPEILIIDEVLAVGDAEFQKKSLGKMESITKTGRTVLFVSHNMNAVESLCNKAMLLREGKIEIMPSDPSQVIKSYLSDPENKSITAWEDNQQRFSNEIFDLKSISLVNNEDTITYPLISNTDDVWFKVDFFLKMNDPLFYFGYALYNEKGQLFYWTQSKDMEESKWPELKTGHNTLYTKLPKRLLNEDNYRIELLASIHFKKWLIKPRSGPSLQFTVQGGLSDSPYFIARRKGFLAPVINWQTKIV